MRKCKYRNCQEIINGRPNKLYCNRKCKSNESKYIFRKRLKRTDKNFNIIPVSTGTSIDEITKLNHYTNFQPFCSKKNLEKSNKL